MQISICRFLHVDGQSVYILCGFARNRTVCDLPRRLRPDIISMLQPMTEIDVPLLSPAEYATRWSNALLWECCATRRRSASPPSRVKSCSGRRPPQQREHAARPRPAHRASRPPGICGAEGRHRPDHAVQCRGHAFANAVLFADGDAGAGSYGPAARTPGLAPVRESLQCPDFGSQRAAQACFDWCMQEVGTDVHQLEADGDGVACESLPAAWTVLWDSGG